MTFSIPSSRPLTPVSYGVFTVHHDDPVAWLVFDRPGKTENAIGQDFEEGVQKATAFIEELYRQGLCKVCILASAKRRFCVGADVAEFYGVTNKDELRTLVTRAKSAIRRVEALPVPTVAALNGDALGGGLELALACDYRVAPNSPHHLIGLPEAILGVLPGLGGTVRFPRLVGLRNGLAFILSGRSMRPAAAKGMGLVDALLPDNNEGEVPNKFLSAAREFALSRAGRKRAPRRRGSAVDWLLSQTPIGRYIVTRRTLRSLDQTTRGKYPAPYRAFETIMAAICESQVEKALDLETEAFADVCTTPQCKALMSLYFCQDRAKKLDAHEAHFMASDVRAVDRVGVLGSGDMARAVGYLLLRHRIPVVLYAPTLEAAEATAKGITSLCEADVKAKRMDSSDLLPTVARLQSTANVDDLELCPVVLDFVTVPAEERISLWAALQSKGDIVLATSALLPSESELSATAVNPATVLGLHFRRPEGKSPVVEVAKGPKTSAQAVATVYKLMLDLGKTPVVTPNSPGYIVDRLMALCFAEAGQLLGTGAHPYVVDRVLWAFGFTVSPFQWADGLGFGAVVDLLQAIRSTEESEVPWGRVLDAMAQHRTFGQPNPGFYSTAPGAPVKPEPATLKALGIEPDMKVSTQEVVEPCVLAMVNGAARLLMAHPDLTAGDVDTALVFGVGFAPWRGGLLNYADSRGLGDVVASMAALEKEHGPRFKPAALLSQMAADGTRFFPDRPLVPFPDVIAVPKVRVKYGANVLVTQLAIAFIGVLLAALVSRFFS